MSKTIRKIRRVAKYSYAIVLPKEWVKSLKWRERQKLNLILDRKKKNILIKDYKSKRKSKK